MRFLTKELEKRFSQAGPQENVNDPLAIAKFFNPAGAGTWYATEYDPKERMFFGYASIFGDWAMAGPMWSTRLSITGYLASFACTPCRLEPRAAVFFVV
jgi:Protein of unknown function (DUF2958)